MTAKTKKTSKPDKTGLAEVKKITKELLMLMGSSAVAQISHDKKNDAIIINLETEEETGLLIGNRGETLNSLQSIIGMIYRQRAGEWKRVLVNISDWRERQEEKMVNIAHQTAQRARETGEPQPLYNLNAAQRRIVHLTLSEEKDLETESQGEGKERFMEVRLKDK